MFAAAQYLVLIRYPLFLKRMGQPAAELYYISQTVDVCTSGVVLVRWCFWRCRSGWGGPSKWGLHVATYILNHTTLQFFSTAGLGACCVSPETCQAWGGLYSLHPAWPLLRSPGPLSKHTGCIHITSQLCSVP